MLELGAAAGTLGTNQDMIKPITDMDTRMVDIVDGFRSPRINSAASIVPLTMDMKSVSCMTPFAHERRVSGKISGRIPSLAGPKKADCSDMKNHTHQNTHGVSMLNATKLKLITVTSEIFVAMMTVRLLYRSARAPAMPGQMR